MKYLSNNWNINTSNPILKALNIHLLYNITGLSFDHNSREIQTRSTSLILIPPETGRRVLPHRDSHRDEVVDENGKFRGLGNENARGCRVITPRRRWGGSFGNRKDRWRGKGALEGGLGRRVLIHGAEFRLITRGNPRKKKRERGIGIWRPRTSFVTLGIVSSAETFCVEEILSLSTVLNNLNRVKEELVGLNIVDNLNRVGEELVGFDMNEHLVLFYHGEFTIGVEELREERSSLWENRVSLELLEREIEYVRGKLIAFLSLFYLYFITSFLR